LATEAVAKRLHSINLLKDEGIPVYTVVIENGRYYDTGNKYEYLKTVVEFALQHDETKEEFKQFLKDLGLK